MPGSPGTEPSSLVRLAVAAARAGAELQRGRAGAELVTRTKSTSTDLVTEIDQASEARVVETIIGARPDDSILGEEGTARQGSSPVRWVIDPLDGTTNFVYGIPAFSVSIAAELDGEVVAAAVLDVSREELFSAARGAGAWLGDRRLARSTAAPELGQALIGTGFGYSPARRAAQARVLATVLPAVRDVRRFGSAALDLCWAAAGRLDGYYEAGLNPWDLAAGCLIAREAGLTVRGLVGDEVDLTVIAAPPPLDAQLAELLGSAGAASIC